MNIMNMNFTEYINKLENEREDKDNMYPVPISDRVALNFLEDYLWDGCIESPISNSQANVIVVHEILYKHSKKYRKEYKKFMKSKRRDKNGKS